MNDELISIIVPVYNSSDTIDKCIDSLINQTYKNIEIIIVDDGSTDNSYDICLKYSLNDSRIKLIKQINSGVSSARNKGLGICKGKYIGFVDSDDYIEKNMYSKLYDNLKKTNSKLAICNYYFENLQGFQLRDFHNEDLLFKSDSLPNYMINLLCINGFLWNKLYSRDLIIKDDFFIKLDTSISMMEDNLFNYQIYECNENFNCTYIDDKLYHYIQNSKSMCNKKYSLDKLQYFIVRNKQIEILNKKNIDADFLKVDFIFNFIKDSYKIKKLKIEKNDLFYSLEEYYYSYKKKIDYNRIPNRLKIKYFISKYLAFIIRISILIRKENI